LQDKTQNTAELDPNQEAADAALLATLVNEIIAGTFPAHWLPFRPSLNNAECLGWMFNVRRNS
jgi:hypothetical protein